MSPVWAPPVYTSFHDLGHFLQVTGECEVMPEKFFFCRCCRFKCQSAESLFKCLFQNEWSKQACQGTETPSVLRQKMEPVQVNSLSPLLKKWLACGWCVHFCCCVSLSRAPSNESRSDQVFARRTVLACLKKWICITVSGTFIQGSIEAAVAKTFTFWFCFILFWLCKRHQCQTGRDSNAY